MERPSWPHRHCCWRRSSANNLLERLRTAGAELGSRRVLVAAALAVVVHLDLDDRRIVDRVGGFSFVLILTSLVSRKSSFVLRHTIYREQLLPIRDKDTPESPFRFAVSYRRRQANQHKVAEWNETILALDPAVINVESHYIRRRMDC